MRTPEEIAAIIDRYNLFDRAVHDDDATLGMDETTYRRHAATQLRALFRPGEKVWAGWIVPDEAVRARLGIRYAKTPIKPAPGDDLFDPSARAGIIEAHILADRIEAGVIETIPTHVSLNPLTGLAGATADGRESFDCLAAIADFRHVLVEFDHLQAADGTPSRAQIEIMAGLEDFAETAPVRPVALVYSGGKSIHTALRVPSGDLDDYRRHLAHLRDLFASADAPALRADISGWATGANAATHIRLAGAIRPETGRRARLLWINHP